MCVGERVCAVVSVLLLCSRVVFVLVSFIERVVCLLAGLVWC